MRKATITSCDQDKWSVSVQEDLSGAHTAEDVVEVRSDTSPGTLRGPRCAAARARAPVLRLSANLPQFVHIMLFAAMIRFNVTQVDVKLAFREMQLPV